MRAHDSSHSYLNLSSDQLIELAVERGEGVLAANQALAVETGARTGRSPKDKFIVRDATTENTIAWGGINQPIAPEKFQALWKRAQAYLQTIKPFVGDYQVGADARYYLPVKAITEYAWHQLFVQQLFIRPHEFHGNDNREEWTLLSLPGLRTDPIRDGVNSDATLIIYFSERKVLLCGHRYAGEMKKAMFSILNYLLPERDVLPMHCSANVDLDKQAVALFFGLSGTGKTTLSADPHRALIGDDEHGWSEEGLFNFEGGCYAKCIDLSLEKEPLIYKAIRKGAVMENVVLHPTTLAPDYNNASLTQNTRAAYPREFIAGCVPENRVDYQPNVVIFLSCDLFGVLPLVSRLTQEQAVYYFLSGYTALVGSTEMGQTEAIKTTFSTCFGAPFFSRPPKVYADLLEKRLRESQAEVYLVNTGWYGGAYGEGQRFPLPVTRQVINAALDGRLKKANYVTLPHFNLAIPNALEGIHATLLDPRATWASQKDYTFKMQELIQKFNNNFQKFDIDVRIQAAGPRFLDTD